MEQTIMKIENELLKDVKPAFKCKDYLVSDTYFNMCYNKKYHLYFTHPIPQNLDLFYQSEDYISHSKKTKGIVSVLYRVIRNYSFKKKVQLLDSFKLSKKILDVGSGTGMFLNYCKSKKWNVFGVEPSIKARDIAKELNINLYKSLEELDENNFSIITLWHVLEHVPNFTETILLLKKKLSKNGRLIIAVPNFESYDANYYKEFWAAYDVPRHLWHFSKHSIEHIFDSFDMVVEKTIPMKFDSFYVSLLSEKHKTGKSNLLKAFFIGLVSNLRARVTNNYSSLIYCLKNKE